MEAEGRSVPDDNGLANGRRTCLAIRYADQPSWASEVSNAE